MKVGSCPICKVELSIKNIDDKYDVQCCSSCKREFYPIKEEERQKSILELQYDIETVSSESGSSPVLLSDEGDYRGFSEEYLQKKHDSYLRRHFPSNAKISSRVDMPT